MLQDFYTYILEQALLHHSGSNLLEACQVSAGNQVVAQAILFSGFSRCIMDGDHLDPYSGFPSYRSVRCAVKKKEA